MYGITITKNENDFFLSKNNFETNSSKSDIKLNILKDNEIELVLSIPLITLKIEEVKIQFLKRGRDISEQFEKLRNKFKTLIDFINIEKSNFSYSSREYNFIESVIKEIQK